MKFILEMGNDGGDSSILGWANDFSSAFSQVYRILGEECFLKLKPIKRDGGGAIWCFVHEGRIKWIRARKIPSAETHPKIEDCSPPRDDSIFI